MSILCMESGGTKLVVALANRDGRLTKVAPRFRRPDQQAQETLQTLVDIARELISPSDPIEAVCLGFGGTVRRSDGRTGPCFHEAGWENLHGGEFLQSAFQVPVFVENDCNLAALGEAHFGASLTQGTLFYATLGTGIGGGAVVDGRLLQSGGLGEAEIGHIVVEEDGPDCACGNRGCLETFCSGPGLARLAEIMTGQRIDAKSLMENYRSGDSAAAETVERAAGYLGRVFGAVINLLEPRVIVLGGGVMRSNSAFLQVIARKTEPYVFPVFRGSTRFTLSVLEDTVVCQGAAVYACQQLNRRH